MSCVKLYIHPSTCQMTQNLSVGTVTPDRPSVSKIQINTPGGPIEEPAQTTPSTDSAPVMTADLSTKPTSDPHSTAMDSAVDKKDRKSRRKRKRRRSDASSVSGSDYGSRSPSRSRSRSRKSRKKRKRKHRERSRYIQCPFPLHLLCGH